MTCYADLFCFQINNRVNSSFTDNIVLYNVLNAEKTIEFPRRSPTLSVTRKITLLDTIICVHSQTKMSIIDKWRMAFYKKYTIDWFCRKIFTRSKIQKQRNNSFDVYHKNRNRNEVGVKIPVWYFFFYVDNLYAINTMTIGTINEENYNNVV